MLTEYNGEQEYSHNYLVWADTQAEADAIAHEHANNWYYEPDAEDNGVGELKQADCYNKEEDRFEFEGGALIVTITACTPADPKEFAMELAAQYTIGNPEQSSGLIVPEKVKQSTFGCINCLWASNECSHSSRYSPKSTTDEACSYYTYYD